MPGSIFYFSFSAFSVSAFQRLSVSAFKMIFNPSQTSSRTTASALRQLKLLVVLLILSNVAIGAFGFYSLRAIDRKYSTLIDQTVPALDELTRLTNSSVETMRSTNPTVYTESPDNRGEAVSRARA